MTKTSVKLSVLKLVYPPISNQEAVWLEGDHEVKDRLRQSDFYMIGGRSEVKFSNLDIGPNTLLCSFKLGNGKIQTSGEIDIPKLPGVANKNWEELHLEDGDKLIRIWDGPVGNEKSTVLDWFTADKILWDRWHNKDGIQKMDNYRDLTSFDLLYVGIAKKGDSFSRLIKKGHKARMDILSNEPQRYPGARVTDEIYLFMFRVEPLVMNTFAFDHKFSDEDLSLTLEQKRIVADAEKAYVSLLKPEYNIIRFNQYPKGEDGLYDSGLARYGYVIGEDVSFNTAHGKVKGGCGKLDFISNDADSIFIEGDDVKLYTAGDDY